MTIPHERSPPNTVCLTKKNPPPLTFTAKGGDYILETKVHCRGRRPRRPTHLKNVYNILAIIFSRQYSSIWGKFFFDILIPYSGSDFLLSYG